MKFPVSLDRRLALIILAAPIVLFLIWYGFTPEGQKPKFPGAPGPTPTTVIPTAPPYTPPQVLSAPSQSDYKIQYTDYNQLYSIYIYGKNYEQIRLIAEQDLLKKLNLTQAAACGQVKLLVSAPYHAQKTASPTYYSFSFCPAP